MSKLIIAGSRPESLTLDRGLRVIDFINYFFDYRNPDVVISGRARGIDTLGEEYALARGIPVIPFEPDYKSYPKKVAPIMRNKEMAKAGDALLLIWNGESKGSNNMKEEMLKLNKPVYEVIIRKHNV